MDVLEIPLVLAPRVRLSPGEAPPLLLLLLGGGARVSHDALLLEDAAADDLAVERRVPEGRFTVNLGSRGPGRRRRRRQRRCRRRQLRQRCRSNGVRATSASRNRPGDAAIRRSGRLRGRGTLFAFAPRGRRAHIAVTTIARSEAKRNGDVARFIGPGLRDE